MSTYKKLKLIDDAGARNWSFTASARGAASRAAHGRRVATTAGASFPNNNPRTDMINVVCNRNRSKPAGTAGGCPGASA